MNSKTLRAKYLKFAILIILICILLGAISACLPFNLSVPELDNNAIDNTAVTIAQNSNDGLGEFNNGYSYVYTDKTKIDKYRAGASDTPYDITIVKVDKTQSRGSGVEESLRLVRASVSKNQTLANDEVITAIIRARGIPSLLLMMLCIQSIKFSRINSYSEDALSLQFLKSHLALVLFCTTSFRSISEFDVLSILRTTV